MKTRVYYDAQTGLYYPQEKIFFLCWDYIREEGITPTGVRFSKRIFCADKEDAIAYCKKYTLEAEKEAARNKTFKSLKRFSGIVWDSSGKTYPE